MQIKEQLFGQTDSKEKIVKYSLINDNGHFISILNYGGIITNINVPDKDGNLSNITLSYDNFDSYKTNPAYFGVIAGRFAGRISNGSFTLNDVTYKLPQNDGTNCLHGGLKGFDKVIWSTSIIETTNQVTLVLNYLSKDMDEGFPGNYDATIKYSWDNDDCLSIEYTATTDKETIHALTNHAYFNLSNDLTSNILNHELMIKADRYCELNDASIPTHIASVENTPFDFRTAKAVGKDIQTDTEQSNYTGGYDHPFVFSDNDDIVASLYCHESGRFMEVTTDMEAVVVYSANYLDNTFKIADAGNATKNGALCLETQYIPNNINFDETKTHTLKPGDIFHSKTCYKFSVK